MAKTTNLAGKEAQVIDAMHGFFQEHGNFEDFEPTLWSMVFLAVGNEQWEPNAKENHNRMYLYRGLVEMFKSIEAIGKS